MPKQIAKWQAKLAKAEAKAEDMFAEHVSWEKGIRQTLMYQANKDFWLAFEELADLREGNQTQQQIDDGKKRFLEAFDKLSALRESRKRFRNRHAKVLDNIRLAKYKIEYYREMMVAEAEDSRNQ